LKKRNNKKLHIAMVGQKTMPAEDTSRGGVEVVVENLAPRLVALGQEVTCYNRKGCSNGGRTEYKGVRLIDVPTIRHRGLSAATSSIFASICVAFGKYDIAHYHAEGPCFLLWLPHLFHKRCIVTIHGLDWQREKWKSGFGSWYIYKGEKIAARYADEIIVLSKSAQEYFRKEYGRETVLIHNGIERAQKRSPKLITDKLGLQGNDYILFLGRIVPEKGIRTLIQAFMNTKTDKKLVIAGQYQDTPVFFNELKRMAEPDPRIIFPGFVRGELLQELYSNCYFYVLPSTLEGMPLGLLEAMSYGCCCLTSDISECTEVTGDHAETFRCGDTDDLQKKMQNLLNDTNRVRLFREGAADYVLSRYNWDEVAKKTLNIYRGQEIENFNDQ
jgi:glycosyltransferase involved in cell wall biosynthesis